MTAFKNKHVLITGGASGIGRQMVLLIAKEGGRIVIWDINEVNRKNVESEIKKAGGFAMSYYCDVSVRENTYVTASHVKDEQGIIDTLINNAGIVSGKASLEYFPLSL